MKITVIKKAELKKAALIKCPFVVEDYATDKK
jgi:hypothetical protein